MLEKPSVKLGIYHKTFMNTVKNSSLNSSLERESNVKI